MNGVIPALEKDTAWSSGQTRKPLSLSVTGAAVGQKTLPSWLTPGLSLKDGTNVAKWR